MSQLTEIARPFAPKLIHPAPSGHGTYVSHDAVTQKLLAVLGPFDFEVTQIVRDADGIVDGCLAKLTVTIDDQRVSITEAGECDGPLNKKTNGDRLKNAASDAFKRCAMRLGCGLHLWADDYFLYGVLSKREGAVGVDAPSGEHPVPSAPAHLEQPELVDARSVKDTEPV